MDRLERIAALRRRTDEDPTDADAYFELAYALRELEDYAAAIPYAERAFDLRQDFADAAKLAALCHHLNRDPESAWPWYQRVIGEDASDPTLLYNAGIAADALLRYEDAIACYRDALAIRPDYPEVLNNLGIALANAGRYEQAVKTFLTLLELRHAPARHQAHCNLGLVYLYQGRLDEAIESLEAALALAPTFAVACCNLGNAYYAKGWMDRAAEMYRRAIELDPDNVLAYNALGALQQESGAVSDAVVREYQAYLDIHPWSALVYYNLGLALADRGNVDEAIEQLNKALTMEPRFEEASRAKQILLRGGSAPREGD